jgi:RNA recognition motif-containing protein
VVLRLEGLPFKVTEEEIREFFTETEAKIENLHLLLNRDQRPSGIGFIELESEADLKGALTLDGKCIGDSKRYVRMGN